MDDNSGSNCQIYQHCGYSTRSNSDLRELTLEREVSQHSDDFLDNHNQTPSQIVEFHPNAGLEHKKCDMVTNLAQFIQNKKRSTIECSEAIKRCKNALDGFIETCKDQSATDNQPFSLKKGIKKYKNKSFMELLMIDDELNIMSREMDLSLQDFKKTLKRIKKKKFKQFVFLEVFFVKSE